jgi:hypothetical protein
MTAVESVQSLESMRRKPRVCLVIPYREGSPEVIDLQSAAQSVSEKFEIRLICQPTPMGLVRLGLFETLRNRRRFIAGGIQLGREALNRSNDLVIGYHPLHAIVGSVVSLFGPKNGRPLIVALTVTVRQQRAGVAALRSALYRIAFLNGRLRLCCSSAVAIAQLVEAFPKVRATFVPELIVQDVKMQPRSADGSPCDRPVDVAPQIFSGGYTGREWRFLCQVAEHLPEFPIRVMTSEESWGNQGRYPSNLQITYSDTKEQFDSALSSARVVLLPLVPTEHSGFLVSRGCGLAKVPLLWSSPSTLDEYRPEGYPVLERSDPKAAAEIIRGVLGSDTARQNLVDSLHHQWTVTLAPSAVLVAICESFLPGTSVTKESSADPNRQSK